MHLVDTLLSYALVLSLQLCALLSEQPYCHAVLCLQSPVANNISSDDSSNSTAVERQEEHHMVGVSGARLYCRCIMLRCTAAAVC